MVCASRMQSVVSSRSLDIFASRWSQIACRAFLHAISWGLNEKR